MLNVLSSVAVVYVVYMVWRLTVGSVMLWRRSYTPDEISLEEVAFEDIPEAASTYFNSMQSELEGLGFGAARLLHLKYFQEQIGASAYMFRSLHRDKPVIADSAWICFKAGGVQTNPGFTSWYSGDREIMTEQGSWAALVGDIPGQDRVVYTGEVSLVDLFEVHELRLNENVERPMDANRLIDDPVEAMREWVRRINRLSIACGATYRHPDKPGYCSSFINVVCLKWRTSLFIRDFTYARHKRRARRWLARAHEARGSG
jgi:hypothetical protein